MRKIITLLFFWICVLSNAQQKIIFAYDSAGNQISRTLCLSGCSATGKKVEQVKEIEALTDEDLQKFFPEDAISYYPNPVKEELFIKWQFKDDIYVSSIQVFSVTGQLLKTYEPGLRYESQNIAFQNYPSGLYAVILYYSNGDKKAIKIIKN